MKPKEIQYDKEKTRIVWDDGHESVYPHVHLRKNCPCASCRDIREKGGEAYAGNEKELVPDDILPVGRYALQPVWSDAHDTGIYSYDYLREICTCEKCIKGEKAKV